MVTDGAEGEFGDTLSVPFRSILGEQNEETLHEKITCLIWPVFWSKTPKT